MTIQDAADRALSAIEFGLTRTPLDPQEKEALRKLHYMTAALAAASPDEVPPEAGTLCDKIAAALALNEANERNPQLAQAFAELGSFMPALADHSSGVADRANAPQAKPAPPREFRQDAPPKRPYHNLDNQFSSTALIILAGAAAFPFVMIFLISLFWLPDGDVSQGFIGEIVKALATRPGNYGGTLQLMILPAAASLTVASLSWIFSGRVGTSLLVICFVGMFAAILDALLFSILSSFDDSTKALTTQYFVMNAGAIFIFIMLLIGLRIALARLSLERDGGHN